MASARKWIPYVALLVFIAYGIANINFHNPLGNNFNSNLHPMENVYTYEKLPLWHSKLLEHSTLAPLPLAGYVSSQRKFLTIGISTVYREEYYLKETLNFLVNQSEETERMDVVVVIFLADTDIDKKEKQLFLIKNDFQKYLDSGFFVVIDCKSDIYPPMDFALTKRTYNTSVDMVLWRTKQSIDFAFLFTYTKSLSDYFLVMEDDVITANGYITAIRDFVTLTSKSKKRWVALEFSSFIGIGLLFKTSDLPKLVKVLLLFHQEQPVDELMRKFISLEAPDENVLTRRIPSIFQHIGIKSTLPNKIQNLKDNTFDMAKRKYRNHNPKADLVTTMEVYKGYIPEYSYRVTPGFFMGIGQPNDTFDIIFPSPINISKIYVTSGMLNEQGKKVDTIGQIKDGLLEISEQFVGVSPNNTVICDAFRTAQTFMNGEVDLNEIQHNIQCVRIKIGAAQNPLVISEVEIFKSLPNR